MSTAARRDPPPRVLFLDDDPDRAAAFRAVHPGAEWIDTAAGCIGRLSEPWDEVHLDHDLGGRRLVGSDGPECGMEVVRWLGERTRPHLRATRFVVHTHNPNAAWMMALHLEVLGFEVRVRPFDLSLGRAHGPRPSSSPVGMIPEPEVIACAPCRSAD